MRTYNFRRSQELLQVDPKTFGRWLEKAGIDPKQQVNLADPREKFLTEEQIRLLAREHGRELPPLDEEHEPEQPPITLAQLYERLSAFEQEMGRRFDELTGLLASLEKRITQALGSQIKATQGAAPRPSPPRMPAKRPTKKTKGKGLPRGLTPVHVFRSLHHVSEKAVEHAIEAGKLPVVRGKWLYQHRYTTTALDAQGRQQFYVVFHEREGFQRCEHCPSSEQGYHS